MRGGRLRLGLALTAVAAVGLGLSLWLRARRPSAAIQTALVVRGEWVEQVEIRGEVKALRSLALTAPGQAGELRILRLVPSGTVVKAGDVVVQLDVMPRQRTLQEEQTRLRQAEAELERAQAQGRLKEEQGLTDLQRAEYDVERARLEARKQEILSAIQGEKSLLSLADGDMKLTEARVGLEASRGMSANEVRRQERRRRKAQRDVEESERGIAAMTLRAPVDGMVTLLRNPGSRSGPGSEALEFKEGDRPWPGAAIAEIPDLSSVRVGARIDEVDRGRVAVGQTASVRVDALPDRTFAGRVSEIGLLARLDRGAWPLAKSFDIVLALEGTDPRLRPGMSATGRVDVEREAEALLVPGQACFEKGGRTVAYVETRWGFEERTVELAKWSTRQAIISKGLRVGEPVALEDPTIRRGGK